MQEGLWYSDTHEWVRIERSAGEQVATVGISAFAVEQLTDLVYVELPKVGDQVRTGQEFGTVESVKAASSLYSPVTGEVVEVNAKVQDDLDLLARDPYGEGWLIKVKLSQEPDLSRLMDEETYRKRVSSQ
ncbi:MAG: glycine cleavage system protein GcvH [Methylohalobius sp.]|nr:glycine cleavage system protein GcvH [Methylohalobius sp.]